MNVLNPRMNVQRRMYYFRFQEYVTASQRTIQNLRLMASRLSLTQSTPPGEVHSSVSPFSHRPPVRPSVPSVCSSVPRRPSLRPSVRPSVPRSLPRSPVRQSVRLPRPLFLSLFCRSKKQKRHPAISWKWWLGRSNTDKRAGMIWNSGNYCELVKGMLYNNDCRRQ